MGGNSVCRRRLHASPDAPGRLRRHDQPVGQGRRPHPDAARQLGLDDKTLVMFSSDNGTTHLGKEVDFTFFHSVGPLRGLKGSLYEGGIRVPMIARWPGKIRPATTTDHLSAFWDVMPTLAEVAGAQAPAGIDGISFARRCWASPRGNSSTSISTGSSPATAVNRRFVWAIGRRFGRTCSAAITRIR